MKANVYYSAIIIFMMSVSLIVITSDKSIVEKFISPLSGHGATAPVNPNIIRSFDVSNVDSAWNVAYCEQAELMIEAVPLNQLESMNDHQLSALVNNANKRCNM